MEWVLIGKLFLIVILIVGNAFFVASEIALTSARRSRIKQMAEEGEPQIIVEGSGIKVTDSEGKEWIDVNGGYNSVNAGYGRAEIGEAAYEQMVKLSYFPNSTTTIPTALLAEKLAQITPGSLSRTFLVSGGSEANETALKIVPGFITSEN